MNAQAQAVAQVSSAVEVMACHYLIAAMWTEQDELNDSTELGEMTLTEAKAECAEFIKRAGSLVDLVSGADGYGSHLDCGTEHPEYAAMGHDLWLTRNGHGVGFWDRAELCAVELADGSNLGDALSNVACTMGEQSVCAGDDGLVYIG